MYAMNQRPKGTGFSVSGHPRRRAAAAATYTDSEWHARLPSLPPGPPNDEFTGKPASWPIRWNALLGYSLELT